MDFSLPWRENIAFIHDPLEDWLGSDSDFMLLRPVLRGYFVTG
jgi:hypothetical protein